MLAKQGSNLFQAPATTPKEESQSHAYEEVRTEEVGKMAKSLLLSELDVLGLEELAFAQRTLEGV